MEKWEKDHISKNLDKLIELTECNVHFLANLEAAGILARVDVASLNRPHMDEMQKSKRLYDMLVTRQNAFNLLRVALKETNQSGALQILRNIDLLHQNFKTITYNKNHVLGRGSSGTLVYEGKYGERDVAVKVQNKNFVTANITQNEIKILIKLDSHPNVIRYFAVEERDDLVLIVLERCGITLHDEIKMRKMKVEELVILKKCTEGLVHLHKHRVIHRDLKPANILITVDKEVKISDFGLSKEIPEGHSNVLATGVIGTLDWMAPESSIDNSDGGTSTDQLKLSTHSDMFALGCIYHYTLTGGVHPFGRGVDIASNIKHGRFTLQKLHANENWSFMIQKMISHQPSNRPSAEEILLQYGVVSVSQVLNDPDESHFNLIPSTSSENQAMSSNAENNTTCTPSIEKTSLPEKHDLEQSIDISSTQSTQTTVLPNDSKLHGVNTVVSDSNEAYVNFQGWQRYTFVSESSQLGKTTKFTDVFLQRLRREEILSTFNFDFTISCIKSKETEKIFLLPFRKPDYYDRMMKIYRETGQSEALAILENGFAKMEKWKNAEGPLCGTDYTSISEAIGYHCDVELLKNLYETHKNKSLLFQTNDEGFTLLHTAAQCGHIEAIKYLISIGLDVNAKTKTDATPLHFSGVMGRHGIRVTEVLLKNGADLFAKDSHNGTVAHTTSIYTTPEEYHDWVQFMVESGHKKLFNERGFYEETPLHFALWIREVSLATLTLFAFELNFDFNSTNTRGTTVLMCAATGGQSRELLEWIVDMGVDWKRRCNYPKSILHYAVQGGNLEAIQYFVSLGADVNDKGKGGYTPLHYLSLSHKNHIEVTKLLLNYKVDLYARTILGDNIAHLLGANEMLETEYIRWKNYLQSAGHTSLFATFNYVFWRPK